MAVVVDAAPALPTAKASAIIISRLLRGFSTCCLRFTNGVAAPMQGSLPAGWLAFAGRELNPLDRYERFQNIMSVLLS